MVNTNDAPMLRAEGFDEAIIGMGVRAGHHDILVYDFQRCIDILTKRDGMTQDEAVEFLEFNLVGAWMGVGTPIFVYPYDG